MVVLVTGLMRSGTSAVAQMLHNAGIPMGTAMLFPYPETRPEYEDAVLSLHLANLAVQRKRPALKDLTQYVQGREQVHGQRWGVKSPFLLPYVGRFRKACEGRPLKVIRTSRPIGETLESLEKLGKGETLEHLKKIQMRLADAVTPEADYVAEYKRVTEDTDTVLEEMLEILK